MSSEEKNGSATAEKEMPQADPVKNENKEKDAKKRLKKLENEVAELKKQLEAAKEASAAENDKYLRMMAEYDNFRKRSAKEKEGIYTDAYSDCVKVLLPVLDNLERAEKCDQLDALKKGVEMTLKECRAAFEKLGVTEVETDHFDPNLHNAVMHVEDDSLGESAIVEVFQKGYQKNGKVIRYAMVKVAN